MQTKEEQSLRKYFMKKKTMLSDLDTYHRLTSDPTKDIKNSLEKLLLEGVHFRIINTKQRFIEMSFPASLSNYSRYETSNGETLYLVR